METPIDTYALGCSHDPRVKDLGEERLPAFQAELAQRLRQQAQSGVLTETYFEYVLTVQRSE